MKISKSNILIIIAIILMLVPLFRDIRDMSITKQEVESIQDDLTTNDECIIDEDTQLLKIDKIDLKLPIKHGATHENMKTSVATMTHTNVVDGGNFTLAGHRNLRRGKNFNRLNELEVGDTITVVDNVKDNNFKVTETKIVEPSEVDILDDNETTQVTLVTCYPIGISTHRLVVVGELIDG